MEATERRARRGVAGSRSMAMRASGAEAGARGRIGVDIQDGRLVREERVPMPRVPVFAAELEPSAVSSSLGGSRSGNTVS